MKQVLVIAYFFPPMSSAAVLKSLKFVKYLSDFQYKPIVLTVNAKYTCWIKDYALLHEIPNDTPVYRTPTIDINWLYKIFWGLHLNNVVKWLQTRIIIPDSEKFWLPFAKLKLRSIFNRHEIDLVYISAGPFSSLLLGPYIRKKYNLEYTVDFRDEWTNNISRLDPNYPSHSRKKELMMEEFVVRNCAAIVYTIPVYMKSDFLSKYPFLKSKLSAEIPNGYDEADFKDITYGVKNHKIKCRIVHTGQFYDHTQPHILWKALVELLNEDSIIPGSLQIDIIGRNTPKNVMGPYFTNNKLMDIVKFRKNINHIDSIKEQCNADILFLYIANGPNCESILTSKVLEYIRTYKPIFAIVPPKGIAAEIIRKSQTGFVCNSYNLSDIKQGFGDIYQLCLKEQLIINPNKEYISQFNRRDLTQKLSCLFNDVLCSAKIDANDECFPIVI